MKNSLSLSETLKTLPTSPGVYMFYSNDVVIYVGKAKNLKRRVSQYFQSPEKLNVKTRVLVSKIERIEHTVVDSEEDALLLENNLIKNFQPKYNILLKDGKTYPWICVKKEDFPRVFITRKKRPDGSLYFGPYSSANHAHSLIKLVNNLYPLRNCNLLLSNENICSGKFKVCLNYHIKKCKAPCVGFILTKDYQEMIDAIVELLKGNTYTLIKSFNEKMLAASLELKFEIAQQYKERIDLLERHYSKSLVVNSRWIDADVFSIILDSNVGYGNFMRIKGGSIITSANFELKFRLEEEKETILSTLIIEAYSRYGGLEHKSEYPKEVIVPFIPDIEILQKQFFVPQKGDKKELLNLSIKNATAHKLEIQKNEELKNPQEHQQRILETLQRDLNLKNLPVHIECFDNSNLQGTNAVSACVVFKNAKPSKKDYRHFNIKTVEGPNDYASMKEVLNRRYSRLLKEGVDLPDLIVVDGGKGQVSSAYEALDELDLLDKIPLIGLAERLEEVIIPGYKDSMFLDKNSSSLRVLMQLRDEAHRFGITHHRNKRSKANLTSELDSISGLGKISKEKLLAKFKTISKIKQASLDQLKETIGSKPANALFNYFHQ